jgi:hypothetical protein
MARHVCVLESDDLDTLEAAKSVIVSALDGQPLDREAAHNVVADIVDLLNAFYGEEDDDDDLEDTEVFDEDDDLIFEPTDGQTTASTY